MIWRRIWCRIHNGNYHDLVELDSAAPGSEWQCKACRKKFFFDNW